MRFRGLLNAGGAGTRMGGALPKPLMPVRGLPLVERNLLALLGAGVREVHLVVPIAAGALHDWARERATGLCATLGARLVTHVEALPRGTAACLSAVGDADTPVMMLYADNLTGLDLGAFATCHETLHADVTVAVHEASFVVPFGRIRAEGDRVVGYDEKPALPVTIASGAYVFSPRAIATVPLAGRLDAPDLVRQRVTAGMNVRTFAHAAPWIDVNDAAALVRAGRLLDEHPALERFAPADASVLEVCGAVLVSGRACLLEWRPATAALSPAVWDTPGGKLEPGETPSEAMARELHEELGLRELALRKLAVLDEVAPGRGWVRHHVFAATLDVHHRPAAREGQTLAMRPLDDLEVPWAQVARRSVAYWGANA